MRKRLAALGASLVLGLSGAALAAQTAQAAPYITICNHGSSDEPIKAYNDDVNKEYLIAVGWCAPVDNANGHARVDVDPSGGNDIDSYKHKRNSEGWSTCFVSENGASNPYNGATTTYWNSVYSACQ